MSGVVGKPTPGPWEFRPESGNDMGGIYSPTDRVCWFGDCTTYYPSEGESPCAEDARLIAAAPELLEALQGIIEIGKRDLSNPKYDGFFTTARAAIAHATGAGHD